VFRTDLTGALRQLLSLENVTGHKQRRVSVVSRFEAACLTAPLPGQRENQDEGVARVWYPHGNTRPVQRLGPGPYGLSHSPNPGLRTDHPSQAEAVNVKPHMPPGAEEVRTLMCPPVRYRVMTVTAPTVSEGDVNGTSDNSWVFGNQDVYVPVETLA